MRSTTRSAASRRSARAITSAGAAGTAACLRRAAERHRRSAAAGNVGAYSVEQANPRHEHEWTVWQTAKLPAGKKLIPGVISHATNIVEHPELVAQRLVRLAKIVGRDNVLGGTDCGFAQSPFAQRVHPSIMWAKLRSLSEGARIASAELWGRRSAA
jgi:Methionine synthase II (cobalamin-independent)